MKKLLATIGLIFIIIILCAAPVIAYSYTSDITVQETNGTDYGAMVLTATIDNQELVDYDFITSTGLDTRILSGGSTERPHMLVDDRVNFYAWTILGNSTTHFDYTFGNSALSSFYIVPGYNGYLTREDNASLELGNNFEIELKGYINTSTSDTDLVYKDGAFRLWVSGSGEITAVIYGTGSNTTNYDPTGNGTYTEGTLVGETTRWTAMQDDLDTSYLVATTSTFKRDTFTNSSIYSDREPYDIINSIRVYWRNKEASDNCTAYPMIVVNSSAYYESEVGYSSTWNWRNDVWTTNPDDSEAWEVEDLDGLEFGYRQHEDTGSDAMASETYVTIDYADSPYVVATGVSSGEHTIKVTADGTNLKIYVDTIEEDSDTLSGASVIDNSNNWLIGQDNTIPYLEYYKHTVSSTLIAHYQPAEILTVTSADETADSGNTTTIVDAALTQVDDYWNHARLIITDTTDEGAPEGEISVITDFDAGTDTLTFGALTAGVDTGDTYIVEFITLPDEEGTAQDAIITTGVNPDGISITIGSAVAESQIIPAGSVETDPEDIIPTGGGVELSSYDVPTSGTIARFVYDIVDVWQPHVNIPTMVMINVGACLIVAAGMGISAKRFPNHKLWTFVTGLILTGLFIGLDLLPDWTMFVYVPIGLALLTYERKPVL